MKYWIFLIVPNLMKKLTMIITGIFLVAGLFGLVAVSNATAAGTHEEGSSSRSVSEFREHYSQMRDIMHNALVSRVPSISINTSRVGMEGWFRR